jgi:hypothetical protein
MEHNNWKDFYSDAVEEMPPDMPVAFGRKARITVYVDVEQAHDVVIWQLVMAMLLFISNTSMQWYLKRQ